MTKLLQRFLHAFSLTAFIIAGMSGLSIVKAAEQALPMIDGEVVALGYDLAGERLLKVHPGKLFFSADEGKSWQPIALPEALARGSLATAAVPTRAGDVLYIAGPGIGVQRSDDAGQSWQALNDGLPSQNVTAFAVHRQQPETLYALVPDDGIYRSEDAGNSWRKMDSGPVQVIRRLLHSDMPGSMQTGWLYAVSDDAVRLSMDCFCGWRLGGELSDAGTVYDVTYDFHNPERVYVATEQGLFRSDDGGQQWQQVGRDDGKLKIALTAAPSGVLYAATPDGIVLRSEDQGQNWE